MIKGVLRKILRREQSLKIKIMRIMKIFQHKIHIKMQTLLI